MHASAQKYTVSIILCILIIFCPFFLHSYLLSYRHIGAGYCYVCRALSCVFVYSYDRSAEMKLERADLAGC